VILAGTSAWCALILIAPVAASSPRLAVPGLFLYAFFSPLCHQIDARSFHLFGQPLAVCGRCSAIYFAFLLGAILYPFARKLLPEKKPGILFLILAMAPMLVDVVLEAFGIDESSNALRAVTGAWFGLLIPFLIIPGAIEGIEQILARPNSHKVQIEKGPIDA
jgi:uncharacterized membrane protein